MPGKISAKNQVSPFSFWLNEEDKSLTQTMLNIYNEVSNFTKIVNRDANYQVIFKYIIFVH